MYAEFILQGGEFTQVLFHGFFTSVYYTLLIPIIFFSALFYVVAFLGFPIRNPRKTFKGTFRAWPKVTVQIPTRNERVAIRCARKCLEFDYPKSKLQIIIGDDSNQPEVSREINAFARKHSMVKVTKRGNNKGYKAGNLNHMLKYSSGEIIVIFDSDFTPKADFLKTVVPHFKDPKVACVQSKWQCQNMMQNRVSKLAAGVLKLYMGLLAMINSKLGVSLLFGSAEAIRKDILVKLGGWQEGHLTEDVEYALRVIREGYKVAYLHDYQTPGEVPFTMHGYFRQQKRWAYGNARAFVEHFKWILFGKRLSIAQKSTLTFTLVGYVSAPILVIFSLAGILAFVSGTPAPINFYKFFSSTGFTILVNTGFLVALFAAMIKERSLKIVMSVIGASLTIGAVVCLGVTNGFINAFLGRKMEWYIIRKAGNETKNWDK